MMGSGKTTVGRALSVRLRRPLLDSDELIEHQQGRTVREIFQAEGEQAFRDVEAQVLVECLGSTELAVISAAGGVVLREENRAALKASMARIVWLCADISVLVDRVKNGVHRPLLDNDPEGILRQMFLDRKALYREVADVVVSVDGRSVSEIVEAVLR